MLEWEHVVFTRLSRCLEMLVPACLVHLDIFVCVLQWLVLLYCKQKSLFQELLKCLYYRLCFQILQFWIFGDNTTTQ